MVANNAVKICYKQVYAIEVEVGWSSNYFILRNAWSSELGLEGGRGGDDDKHFSPVYLRPDGNETDPLPLPCLVIVLLAL